MKKYFLSICAIVKNEVPYILEWIAFHKLQGVEHFYLYDNGSDDGTFELLENLQTKGLVSLEDWSAIKPVQLDAYNDCLREHRKDSEWIAAIDIDEFLYSETYPNLQEHIKSILYFTSHLVGAIAAHWFLFGSNGHKDFSTDLVIERFTKRQPNKNYHVKSIVNTEYTLSTGKDPHTFYFKDNYVAVNDAGKPLPKDYALSPMVTVNSLIISHYHTKSRAEYFERKKLGDPQTMVIHSPERIEEMFQAHDLNEVEDTYLKDKYSQAVKNLIVEGLI